MIDQIKQISGWESLTAEEIEAYFATTQRVPVADSDAVWSIAGIARVFGVEVAETIYQGILAAGLQGMAARFAATGLDTRDPQWVKFANQLADVIPALEKYREQIASIGFRDVTNWELLGGVGDLPTAEAIEIAISTKEIEADETRYELLLTVNRAVDGRINSYFRITPVEYADGVELRRRNSEQIKTDDLDKQVSSLIEGLLDGR